MTTAPAQVGLSTLTPYLIVQGALEAIDFYIRALEATETLKVVEPGGRVTHAEIQVGEARIMLADEAPDRQILGPSSLKGSPVHLLLFAEDVDRAIDRALEAGATLTLPVADQPYGARMGGFKDPFGHLWYLSTRF